MGFLSYEGRRWLLMKPKTKFTSSLFFVVVVVLYASTAVGKTLHLGIEVTAKFLGWHRVSSKPCFVHEICMF